MKTTMIRSKVKYEKVSPDDGYIDAQFIKPPPKVPWRAIFLATFLFSVGTVLLVIGSLLFTGYIDVKYADRTYPMLILGSLMFIPGFYHVRIAYYAWKGYRGYSFDDIPDFD
ncbi:transmembrane protein 230-like [Acropora muricata]|uniref:transmembrane protein 230-like n=1 Tax=Acropora millepora TaxID=45264 RepID=UPI0010FCB25E|nr:transmembrane protein 230-like [Acropora millepora]